MLATLFHIPYIQHQIASTAQEILSDELNTKVSISRVDLGFLNRFVVDDVMILDRKGKDMLKISRLSVKLDIIPLLEGRISLSSAQLFGLNANINRKDGHSPLNCQFIIDKLSSDNTEDESPLNLHISSLVIRNGRVNYDCLDKPDYEGEFSADHIHIDKISSHIMVNEISDENIDIRLKKLSLREHSGIWISNLSFYLTKSANHIEIKNLTIKTPHTEILGERIAASNFTKDGKINISKATADGFVRISNFSFKDIQPFVHFDCDVLPDLRGDIRLRAKSWNANLKARNASFALQTSGSIGVSGDESITWLLKSLDINATPQLFASLSEIVELPAFLSSTGNISISTKGQGTDHSAEVKLDCMTGIGNLNAVARFTNGSAGTGFSSGKLSANIDLKDIDLGLIADSKDLGKLNAHLSPSITIDDKKIVNIEGKADVASIEALGNVLTNITANGNYRLSQGGRGSVSAEVSANDPLLTFSLKGSGELNDGNPVALNTDIGLTTFHPHKLGISDTWGDASIAANASINLQGTSIDNYMGNVRITDFMLNGQHVNTASQTYTSPLYIGNISLTLNGMRDNRSVCLNSDFADIEIAGRYDITSLASSFTNTLYDHISTIPGIPVSTHTDQDFTLNATIRPSDVYSRLMGLPVEMSSNLTIGGYVNDDKNSTNIYVNAPDCKVSNYRIKDAKMLLWTPATSSLNFSCKASVVDNLNRILQLDLESSAAEDQLNMTTRWNTVKGGTFNGTVNASIGFGTDADNESSVNVSINPSDIQIGDTVWHLHSKDIKYTASKLTVDNFAIENEHQHLYVNGVASKHFRDSITAELKNINLEYILNLVNFHSVEFRGNASGYVTARSVFDSPAAKTHLDVADFHFENGRLGTLHVDGVLNNTDEQIDIEGIVDDKGSTRLNINGFVSPQREGLDLHVKATNTRMDFVNSFCSSFIDDSNLHGTGAVRVYGPFSNVNLTGNVTVNGDLNISPLNCRYTLNDAAINFIPDDIQFIRVPLYDRDKHVAYVNGGLHHKHLTSMTYDFDIDTDNFLAYDFTDFGESTFYGTAYLSGRCDIHGRNSELEINVNGNVERGSSLMYNASSPESITQQEFITWHSSNQKEEEDTEDIIAEDDEEEEKEMSTNIRMNFLLNVNDKSRLSVLMDKSTGDVIDLYGNGMLRASFYNKGTFDLFGNYLISKGTYRLTIQNVIRRDFEFESGGDINFNGDPFNALLNMRAKYTLNSVPLSDLNIGSSFSNNNMRVDCLMKIGGTAGAPRVEFDMNLPTVHSEARQMIYSLINSEEEMNQQVLYLLSVGRFYAQATNNSSAQDNRYSRTEQAMQSILSGTVSQQINSLLGQLVNSRNWNFGANISPGNEGFYNAEYEGIFNGNLLNNRLLFNGQFGYRNNANTATQGFIGDFDLQYLLVPNGNVAVKVYNQTNDRYFSRNTLNTQGLGIILKRDFNTWRELFGIKKSKNKNRGKE